MTQILYNLLHYTRRYAAMTFKKIDVLEYLKSEFELYGGVEAKYENLAHAIKNAVEQGVLLRGSSLPGERKLADTLNISRITVRSAIDTLVSEGHLVRRHGARTTVSSNVRKQISNLLGFSEDIRSRGMLPGMRLLSAKVVLPTELERSKLKLNTGEKIVKLKRVRLSNDRPIAIECAVVPQSVVKSPEAIGPSLYATLDALGVMPERGVQRISAKIMNEEEAELLGMPLGSPALVVERCCDSMNGIPVEYTVTCYNADVCDFSNELQR